MFRKVPTYVSRFVNKTMEGSTKVSLVDVTTRLQEINVIKGNIILLKGVYLVIVIND